MIAPVWSITNQKPGYFHYLKERQKKIHQTLIKFREDNNGIITSISSTYWSESYTYDSNNNLITIERKFNPYGKDSTGFMTFCLSTANKWVGEYDSHNQLFSETTYWDNGQQYAATHSFTNGVLTSSEYVNPRTNMQELKKYFYANGVLREEQVFDSSGKLIQKLTYAWTVIPRPDPQMLRIGE